tara:strand:+ start:1026 stop:1733 length:708 start_codon:yes stop_codon:yes gene_type:complete
MNPDQDAMISAVDMLVAGGPVVMILAAASVFALTIVLLKLWQFAVCRVGQRRVWRDALALFRSGDKEQALQLADASRNPAAQVLAMSLRGQLQGHEPAVIRDEVTRYGMEALNGLKSGMRPLEVIASLAPLLGLFGTVLGMIEAFQQLEQAGSQVNPALLSGGIWQALLTTAVGLAVAIPLIAIINWLERRIETLAMDMESAAMGVFAPDLSAETGLQLDRDNEPRRPILTSVAQ